MLSRAAVRYGIGWTTALVVALALTMAPSTTTAAPAKPATSAARADDPVINRVHTVGRSAQGRPIRVLSRGRASATVNVLVIGVIHGGERAGLAVVRRLARSTPPPGVRYWLAETINPDAHRRSTRQNARGVDLNRNFPHQWRGGGRPWDTYYPGRARASEPETRAAMTLVRLSRPDVTLWYHQHLDMVIQPQVPWRVALARTYSRASGLRLRHYPFGRLYGTAIAWQEAEQPRSAALVIELPAGALPARSVIRHTAAVRATALAAARDSVPSP